MNAKGRIAYIVSDNRSGSTLLDLLLGAHPSVISLGELHHLRAYAKQDRSLYDPKFPLLCSCGLSVGECTFWVAVQSHLRIAFSDMRLRFAFPPAMAESAIRRLCRQLVLQYVLPRRPAWIRNPALSYLISTGEVAAHSFLLYDAILEVSNARIVVDSSKSPARMRALFDYASDRLIVIALTRHYLGVINSKMKHGRGMMDSAYGWRHSIEAMERLVEGIPTASLIRLRYEDLCENPEKALRRLCGSLGLDFRREMLARSAYVSHRIGGSPSQFDPSRTEIRLDNSYTEAFSRSELQTIKKIVGDVAERYGYH